MPIAMKSCLRLTPRAPAASRNGVRGIGGGRTEAMQTLSVPCDFDPLMGRARRLLR